MVAAFDGVRSSRMLARCFWARRIATGLMSRFAGCFHARAASGQAAAPPTSEMNSRRLMPIMGSYEADLIALNRHGALSVPSRPRAGG